MKPDQSHSIWDIDNVTVEPIDFAPIFVDQSHQSRHLGRGINHVSSVWISHYDIVVARRTIIAWLEAICHHVTEDTFVAEESDIIAGPVI